MKNVKRVFFLTEEEVRKINKETGDGYIYERVPHYELEDGTIIYGKIGYPGGGEVWWDNLNPIINSPEKK